MRILTLSTSTALAFGAIFFSTQALAADPFTADMRYQAEYGDGSSVVITDSGSDSSMAWASISESYGGGYAASNQNGILGAQAIAGGGGGNGGVAVMRGPFSTLDADADSPPVQVMVLSEARWEATITNNHDSPLDYRFIFHVYGPTLQTASDSGEARVSLNIFSDLAAGDSYAADASLVNQLLSADARYGAYSYDAATNEYHFGSFDAALSIGTIAAGASFTLTYVMTAYAYATDMEHRSLAYIGDPFNFNFGPDYQMITSTPPGGVVPEPASWALMLAGFGLVGLVVRRRQRPAFA